MAAEHVQQRITGRLIFLIFVFFADLFLLLGGLDVDNSGFNAAGDLSKRRRKRFRRARNLKIGLRDRGTTGQDRADADSGK